MMETKKMMILKKTSGRFPRQQPLPALPWRPFLLFISLILFLVFPSSDAKICITPSNADGTFNTPDWYYWYPSVAYNFNFQHDAKQHHWDVDIYMSGIPYYYDLLHGYTPEQLQQQTNYSTSKIILKGLQRIPLRGPDSAVANKNNQGGDNDYYYKVDNPWEEQQNNGNRNSSTSSSWNTNNYGGGWFDDDYTVTEYNNELKIDDDYTVNELEEEEEELEEEAEETIIVDEEEAQYYYAADDYYSINKYEPTMDIYEEGLGDDRYSYYYASGTGSSNQMMNGGYDLYYGTTTAAYNNNDETLTEEEEYLYDYGGGGGGRRRRRRLEEGGEESTTTTTTTTTTKTTTAAVAGPGVGPGIGSPGEKNPGVGPGVGPGLGPAGVEPPEVGPGEGQPGLPQQQVWRSLDDDETLSSSSLIAATTKTATATATQIPNVLITPFRYFDDGVEVLETISDVAHSIDATFVVLVMTNSPSVWDSIKAGYFFWWNQRLPQLDEYLKKKKQQQHQQQTLTEESELFFIVVPSGQEEDFFWQLMYSEPIYDFAFDDTSNLKGRDLVASIILFGLVVSMLCIWVRGEFTTIKKRNSRTNDDDFHLISFTSDDLGRGEINTIEGAEVDRCAICLEAMPTKTSVCVLPCRHVFHPFCMDIWLREQQKKHLRQQEQEQQDEEQQRSSVDGNQDEEEREEEEGNWDGTSSSEDNNRTLAGGLGLFYCPLCKYDLRQHLVEHRAAREELTRIPPGSQLRLWLGSLVWHWKRHRQIAAQTRQVLLEQSRGEGGDLELTVEDTPSTSGSGGTNDSNNNEVNLVV